MIYALPAKAAKISSQMALRRIRYEYIKSERREPQLIVMHHTDADAYMQWKESNLNVKGTKELLIFEGLQIVRTDDIPELTVIIL